MEVEKDNVLKNLRKAAIVDAAKTIGDGHISKLARQLCPELRGQNMDEWIKRMHNWRSSGGKLYYWVVTEIFENAQVSPDRLAPLEIRSNDKYFSQNPLVKIFDLDVKVIKPPYFKVPGTKPDPTRPVILDLRNRLIFGKETLELARQAGQKAISVIRIDARALLIYHRPILKHPDGWLDVELRAIASYLEAFAKEHRIILADSSSLINRRLGLNDIKISNAMNLTFFAQKSKPNDRTKNDDLSEYISKPKNGL